MKTSCSQTFEHNARFTYATKPEKPSTPEVESKIPESGDITPEHIDKVLKAIDSNISDVEDYYNFYFTKEMQGEKIPKPIEKKLAKLKQLRAELRQLRANPRNSRRVLIQIYKIFDSLQKHAKGTQESAKGDPLAGLGISDILKPELYAKKKAEKAERPRESKEAATEHLAWEAVENIARAGGKLTQPMLDALKSYKGWQRRLRFDFRINGNPVVVFVERGPNGFAATGGITNEEKLAPNQAPTWKGATFTYAHSFDVKDEKPPAVRTRPMKEYRAMIEKGQLIPEKAV